MAHAVTATGAPPEPRRPWYHNHLGLLFALLSVEGGMFLVTFPWSRYWDFNYFSWLSPEWRELWISPYFRGAVSGLGVMDLYLALVEVFHLQHFSLRHPPDSRPPP